MFSVKHNLLSHMSWPLQEGEGFWEGYDRLGTVDRNGGRVRFDHTSGHVTVLIHVCLKVCQAPSPLLFFIVQPPYWPFPIDMAHMSVCLLSALFVINNNPSNLTC